MNDPKELKIHWMCEKSLKLQLKNSIHRKIDVWSIWGYLVKLCSGHFMGIYALQIQFEWIFFRSQNKCNEHWFRIEFGLKIEWAILYVRCRVVYVKDKGQSTTEKWAKKDIDYYISHIDVFLRRNDAQISDIKTNCRFSANNHLILVLCNDV